MRLRFPIALALGAFLVASCQDTPIEPVKEVTTAPTFNFMNNPGWLANGKIFRYQQDDFGWIGWDWDRELIAVFWTGSGDFCGIGQDIGPIDVQEVYHNPGLADEIQHSLLQGDVWVDLYDWTGTWDPFVCDNYASTLFMASGEMRIVFTDNDVTAFLGHPRNNSWGFNGSGRLALDGGGKTNINYVFHQTWNPEKAFGHTIEKLNISHDPR